MDNKEIKEAGWIVEEDGIPIARIGDYRYLEMFWDSYLLEPYPEYETTIMNDDYWDRSDFRFRSILFETILVDNVICRYRPDGCRLIVRGLYYYA
jgi:hypothetical protein